MTHRETRGNQPAGPEPGGTVGSPGQQATAGAESGQSGPPFRAPAISLPTGGGAIRSIGEKFAANPQTGTASMTLPVEVTTGRAELQPELVLSYDSGRGNGAFGVGWSLDLPSITRKSDQGLPRFDDSAESDVFIMSGIEDLVPAFRLTATGEVELDAENRPLPDEEDRNGYHVSRYRPRGEDSFARIERWTETLDAANVFWRVISRDNVTSVYGRDRSARVFDPDAEEHIVSWLISESWDDKGNTVRYTYKEEDSAGVLPSLPYERHRRAAPCTTQRYVKSITYGNVTSRLHPEPPSDGGDGWLFEVVFDYGEGHYVDLPADPATPLEEQQAYSRASLTSQGPWPVRVDPFSTYRAGFEIRTYRRCQRVLMFHRFPELGAEPCLVRSLELEYLDLDPSDASIEAELAHPGSNRFMSRLISATAGGFERAAPGVTPGPHQERYVRYLRQAMPSVTLGYSLPVIAPEVRTLEASSVANLPVGLAEPFAWVDLDGEGICGVLSDLGGAVRYKRNVGGGQLAAADLVAGWPAGGLAGRRLLDLAGDGALDIVEVDTDTPGFFERTDDFGWAPHRTFRSLPRIRWDSPNLHFVDLDGDGRADLLVTEDDAVTWQPSLGEEGFGPAFRLPWPLDDDAGPRLVFADGTGTVFLADMSGDGLVDLVRITSSSVSYWPNLGYGRFGARVSMENPPVFDHEEMFNPSGVRLADLDGSGVTDIAYVGRDGVRLFLNQSGNRWSDAVPVPGLPHLAHTSSVSVVDLLGDGTSCLVWSSPLPADASTPLRYVRLMAEGKPHLLVAVANNLGAETRIHYESSTQQYLKDRARAEPWASRLPFPVHVVGRVETIDRVSRSRFVSRYEYHHGCFDPVEREFRGFGRVDRYDTDEYDELAPPAGSNLDSAAFLPPVLTRTWFHTGVDPGAKPVSRVYDAEYYRDPAAGPPLDDAVLPDGLTADEQRQAIRALRGSTLRQETYALDGSAEEGYPFGHPYVVAQSSAGIRLVQPSAGQRHAVFLTHQAEALQHHYERDPSDPRVVHTLILEVNRFGQVARSASVAYGRRSAAVALPSGVRGEQRRLHATFTETSYTNALVDPDETPEAQRLPLPFELREYHLTGLELAPGQTRFSIQQLRVAARDARDLAYEQAPTTGELERRVIECRRERYRRDDLSGPCDWGRLEPRALPFEDYRLAFTPGLLARTYERVIDGATENLLPDPLGVLSVGADAAGTGGYVDLDSDGSWWVPSGRMFYGPDDHELDHALRHFFLPQRFRDPFHSVGHSTETVVGHDQHDVRIVETTDALSNRVTSELDYRVLAARRVTDANENRSAVTFDALGNVVATALMGKIGAGEGDELQGFTTYLTQEELRSAFDDPYADPSALLGSSTTRVVRDLFAYLRTAGDAQPAPAGVYVLGRETHVRALPATGAPSRVQHTFTYYDGLGRTIQTKVPAEPGPGTPPPRRWTGTGWRIFDNKGNLVRQFEPFFSDTHRCDLDARIGVARTLFHDPVGRVVAVLHPDHTYEKVLFGPWHTTTYDANDTVAAHGDQTGDPRTDPDIAPLVRRHFEREGPTWQTWQTSRQAPGADADAADAATKAIAHVDTPVAQHVDALGRPILTRAHNGFAASGRPVYLDTRVGFDIEGNQRTLVDAQGRMVEMFDYDLLGSCTRQSSMEAGERWNLADVTGQPLRAWDGRGHGFRVEYDTLRRPERHFVQGGSALHSDPGTTTGQILFQRQEYGEQQPDPAGTNLRGRLFRQFDGAGMLTRAYDFKGNVVREVREVTPEYESLVDWSQPQPEGERFVAETRYDALDRPVQMLAPQLDGALVRNVLQPAYNEANLVDRLDVWVARLGVVDDVLDPAAEPPSTEVGVTGVDYDAHGRRTAVRYSNGASTSSEYDSLTFRLVGLYTRRDSTFTDDCGSEPPRAASPSSAPSGTPCGVQNLRFTYDPVGNVTRIRDDAQQGLFFRNRLVDASTDYTYDPLYRLVRALGREHVGQAGGAGLPHSYSDSPRRGLPHRGDGRAMGRYCETYQYDRAGNLQAMRHRASCPGALSWSRTFAYEEPTQLDNPGAAGPPGRNNRLSASTVGGTTETFSVGGDGYDRHGNLLRMPHLQELVWDFQDQLRMSRRQAVSPADVEGTHRHGERTFYVYDATGQRARKVTRLSSGALKDERLYLGDFEIYRQHAGSNAGLVRETQHVMDAGQRIALIETRNDVDDGTPRRVVRYQHGNHVGSVGLELDGRGRVLTYEEYTPYGSTTYQATRTDVRVSAKRYRYTGKERDEESGLTYHGGRYAAAWLGRWISADPVQDVNKYYYCQANPVGFVDPDGRAPLGADQPRPDAGVEPAAQSPPVKQRGQIMSDSELKELQDSEAASDAAREEAKKNAYNDYIEGPYFTEDGEGYYPPRLVHGPKPAPVPPADKPEPDPEPKPPAPPPDPVEEPENPTMVFDPVDIYGRVNRPWRFPPMDVYGRVPKKEDEKPPPPPPPPPSKIETNAIRFKSHNPTFDDPDVAAFADKDYVTEVQKVADYLTANPGLNVRVEAHIGYEGFLAWGPFKGPLGRTPDVHKKYGAVMDARARAVRDALIRRGIPSSRIDLARGSADVGKANQKVEFYFYPRP